MTKIITPMITPLNDEELPDYDASERVLNFLAHGGVDGVLLLGSTGEFTAFSTSEKHDFFSWCAAHAPQGIELYAGTGCNKLSDTVMLTREAAELGFAGSLVIGPSYFATSQDELCTYYSTIAERVAGAAVYIYNYPARTGQSVAPETLARLVETHDNICGMKDSVLEPSHTRACTNAAHRVRASFEVYSGFDDQFVNNVSFGGAGGVGGLSNVVPEIWHDLVAATRAHEFDKTFAYQEFLCELMPLYDFQSNCPLIFKHILCQRGVDLHKSAIFPYQEIDQSVLETAMSLFEDVFARYQHYLIATQAVDYLHI